MKLSTETIALFRDYFEALTPAITTFRHVYKASTQLEELDTVFVIRYVTDKANLAIIDLEKQWPITKHVLASYVPNSYFIEQMEPDLLRKVLASVANEFPKIDAVDGRSLPEDLFLGMIQQQSSAFVEITTSIYFALLVHLGQSSKDEAFEISIRQLDEQLDPAALRYYSHAYLYNLEIEPHETPFIKLSEDVEIRLTTLGDTVRNIHTKSVFRLPIDHYLPPDYIATWQGKVGPLDCFERTIRAYNFPVIESIVTALRLNASGYVGRGSVGGWYTGLPSSPLYQEDIPDATVRSLSSTLFPGELREPENKYCLHASDTERLREIFADLQASAETGKLDVALSRFNTSYSRKDLKERIIDLVVALENLFGEETIGQSTEVGYRLRMRAARYLGQTPNERICTAKFLSQIYTLRSKIVHGDSRDVDKTVRKTGKSLDEAASELEDLVRRAIRELLRHPDHLGQDYQNGLLLGAELSDSASIDTPA